MLILIIYFLLPGETWAQLSSVFGSEAAPQHQQIHLPTSKTTWFDMAPAIESLSTPFGCLISWGQESI